MIDPKKAIHLVTTDSAKGILKYYFETNFPDDHIQIHSIRDPLTVGPLNDFTSFSDYKAYASFWKNINKVCNSRDEESAEDYFQSSNFINQFTIDFPQEIPLIIWHGTEAGEKLMVYRYCSLLKNRELYEINLDDWPMYSEDKNPSYPCNNLALRNPESLNGIFKIQKKITEENKSFYASEWKRLKEDKKLNRILQNGKIISVEEDYYDQSILNNCSPEYKNAARVIGETMSQQESTIGDYYLWYRVHLLINQNLLEWKGDLSTMRHLEIRKK